MGQVGVPFVNQRRSMHPVSLFSVIMQKSLVSDHFSPKRERTESKQQPGGICTSIGKNEVYGSTLGIFIYFIWWARNIAIFQDKIIPEEGLTDLIVHVFKF
jgi:hypothetical protein